MIKEKAKKAWQFVKKHKDAFIVAGATLLGGTIMLTVGSKVIKSTPTTEALPSLDVDPNWAITPCKESEAIGWNMGVMTDLWNQGGCPTAIINEVTIGEMGKFGEECTKIDGVTSDTVTSVVISFFDPQNADQ